jgi:hypothetical protein
MPYITKGDVATLLNITLNSGGDALLDQIIPAVEAYADNETNRTWSKGASTDITEKFDGGKNVFFVAYPKVASIQSITVDGSVLSSDQYYNYGTFIQLDFIPVNKPQTVVIVYRSSANTAPADVKHALIQWAAQIFKAQADGGKVASRVQAGAFSVDFVTRDGVPAFVEQVLSKYRLFNI